MAKIDIVDKILETDLAAKEIADRAKLNLKNLDNDLKAESEKLRKSYFDRANLRIKNVIETETRFAEETIAELNRNNELEIHRVKEAFKKNGEEWVGTVFKYITGVSLL